MKIERKHNEIGRVNPAVRECEVTSPPLLLATRKVFVFVAGRSADFDTRAAVSVRGIGVLAAAGWCGLAMLCAPIVFFR